MLTLEATDEQIVKVARDTGRLTPGRTIVVPLIGSDTIYAVNVCMDRQKKVTVYRPRPQS